MLKNPMPAPTDPLSPQALKARFEEVRLAKAAARNLGVAAAAVALLLYGLVRVNVSETAELPVVGLVVDPVLTAVYGPALLSLLALRGCALIRLARSEAAALRDAEAAHEAGRPVWVDAVRDLSQREGSHPRFRGMTWGSGVICASWVLIRDSWRSAANYSHRLRDELKAAGFCAAVLGAAKRARGRWKDPENWHALLSPPWKALRALLLALTAPEVLTLLATLLVAWGLYVSDFRNLTPDWRNQHTAKAARLVVGCPPPAPLGGDLFYVRGDGGEVIVIDPWASAPGRNCYWRPLEGLTGLPCALAMTRQRILERELPVVRAAAERYAKSCAEGACDATVLPRERNADDLEQSVRVEPWYVLALPGLLVVASAVYCWTVLMTVAAWEAEAL